MLRADRGPRGARARWPTASRGSCAIGPARGAPEDGTSCRGELLRLRGHRGGAARAGSGPLLAIVGESPAARTLGELGADDRLARRRASSADGADAVVVATMGRGDEEALAAALAAAAGYVGPRRERASGRGGRPATLCASAGVDEEALARVRSPAGLDLGPSTQEEIAVAILAELVAWRHTAAPPGAPPAEAVDPVCGMTVAVEGADQCRARRHHVLLLLGPLPAAFLREVTA